MATFVSPNKRKDLFIHIYMHTTGDEMDPKLLLYYVYTPCRVLYDILYTNCTDMYNYNEILMITLSQLFICSS
jgi:hypothetical protein